jgi:hypothetical protein
MYHAAKYLRKVLGLHDMAETGTNAHHTLGAGTTNIQHVPGIHGSLLTSPLSCRTLSILGDTILSSFRTPTIIDVGSNQALTYSLPLPSSYSN